MKAMDAEKLNDGNQSKSLRAVHQMYLVIMVTTNKGHLPSLENTIGSFSTLTNMNVSFSG